MNGVDDNRFEQRAVDPAGAYGPALLLAFFVLLLAAFVGTETVALSYGRQASLGANVAGLYQPFAGFVWELKCRGGAWASCRVPKRWQHVDMDRRVFAAWSAQAQARREAELRHFDAQHVIWIVGLVLAIGGGVAVGSIRYRALEKAQRSTLHGSSEFATWDELRDAGYIAGVAPVVAKKS